MLLNNLFIDWKKEGKRAAYFVSDGEINNVKHKWKTTWGSIESDFHGIVIISYPTTDIFMQLKKMFAIFCVNYLHMLSMLR